MLSATECKNRWNNIRDQYRKSLKKEVTRSGQAASGIRPYKYRDMLSFLQQSFEERNTISSIDHPREPAQNEDAGLSDDLDNDEDEVVGHEPESQLIQPRHPTSKNLARKKSPYARKKNTKQDTASASSKLMDFLIAKKTSNTEPHPVDTFLGGIAPVLKTLDRMRLHKARAEIFGVVQKYELEMLLQHENDPTNVPSTNMNLNMSPRSDSSTPLPNTLIMNEPSYSIMSERSIRTPSPIRPPTSESPRPTFSIRTGSSITASTPQSSRPIFNFHSHPNIAPEPCVSDTVAPQCTSPSYMQHTMPTTIITLQPPLNVDPTPSTSYDNVNETIPKRRKIIDFGTNNPLTMQQFIEAFNHK